MIRRGIARDTRGAVLVEFAIIAPVMILLMMGLGDMLYTLYAKAVLNGAVQKAARDSGIQGGALLSDTIDGRVAAMMGNLMPTPINSCAANPTVPTWCSTRKSYSTFSQIAPEPFTDLNNDGIRQVGECYSDINGNKQWDADPGKTGQGGANDVTVYTMTITYPRVFPVARLFGWSTNSVISATTTLKNQPYASQAVSTPANICT